MRRSQTLPTLDRRTYGEAESLDNAIRWALQAVGLSSEKPTN
jgi:hypothetical protein